MRVPAGVLALLASPGAIVVIGCGSEVAPRPVAPPPALVVADVRPRDPVAYDAASEGTRLAREDALETTEVARRARRLEESALSDLVLMPVHWDRRNCGRG